ncbi:MAG: hypothetical protein U5R31_05285, partial [Acidimicrobiia bacterium]|nr:hypothetical protein [Acidimicrobiia bacterium]
MARALADGRWPFCSYADNLVPDDTNNALRRVRPRRPGRHHHPASRSPATAPQRTAGRPHAGHLRRTAATSRFRSGADNLAPRRHQRPRRRVRPRHRGRHHHPRLGRHRRHRSQRPRATGPAISADGRYIAFQVFGPPNLVPDDTNAERYVFVRDVR